MAKDYYLILGVPLDAEPDAIRSAFRKLVLRYHPDRGGEADPSAFQDVAEAYHVLSDPTRRARYNRELERGRGRVPMARAGVPVREPEPLISEPVSITGQPETVRPSLDALLERLGRNFSRLGMPKAEREEPLDFELILTPEEAARGVLVPFQVPTFSVCFRCGGTGLDWLYTCDDCGGEGRIIDEGLVDVRVPSGVRDGALIEISLEPLGIENLWLRVHVHVERH